MPVAGAGRRICETVGAWEGVTIGPHRYGGKEFCLGKRELGHIHGDRLVDIPFPKSVRDEIVAAGDAEPHHILPDSGWISLFLRTESDVEVAIRLLQRSFSLASSHRTRSAARPAPEKGR